VAAEDGDEDITFYTHKREPGGGVESRRGMWKRQDREKVRTATKPNQYQ